MLENESRLVFNRDFFCGYSPERPPPCDQDHTLEKNQKKITSGSTIETAEIVDKLYNAILQNGTHRVSSIKVIPGQMNQSASGQDPQPGIKHNCR